MRWLLLAAVLVCAGCGDSDDDSAADVMQDPAPCTEAQRDQCPGFDDRFDCDARPCCEWFADETTPNIGFCLRLRFPKPSG